MKKTSTQRSTKRAVQLLNRLSPSVKLHLVRRLEQQLWPARFRQLLNRIDRRLQSSPRLAQGALKRIGPARRAFHARRARH